MAYKTDIRAMVDIIKDAVSQHPQVISGDAVPFEERPDCEIDSFGDSGVNMFVEFWIEGVDDGKNRVGGDLLLTVFETLKEHGIEIPGEIKVNLEKMISRKNTVVDQTTKGIEFLMKKNKIDVYNGLGSFKDANHIIVSKTDGTSEDIETKHVIIATGSTINIPVQLKLGRKNAGSSNNFAELIASKFTIPKIRDNT